MSENIEMNENNSKKPQDKALGLKIAVAVLSVAVVLLALKAFWPVKPASTDARGSVSSSEQAGSSVANPQGQSTEGQESGSQVAESKDAEGNSSNDSAASGTASSESVATSDDKNSGASTGTDDARKSGSDR